MKKSIYFLMVFVVSTIFFNIKVNMQKDQLPIMTLQNVEALSDAESSDVMCHGIGSVDCPKDQSKVVFVYE
ncbi:hypothetical protein SDC9_198110 [bioreactor metagenome]|uniref:NVEALA family protein n=1 Tax=bioreactor metagenome TaxID=1076179 RepID=A0A645ITK0_9ZZZZ|nr:NVEALA domain-containing protein [Paludibacter sp.]